MDELLQSPPPGLTYTTFEQLAARTSPQKRHHTPGRELTRAEKLEQRTKSKEAVELSPPRDPFALAAAVPAINIARQPRSPPISRSSEQPRASGSGSRNAAPSKGATPKARPTLAYVQSALVNDEGTSAEEDEVVQAGTLSPSPPPTPAAFRQAPHHSGLVEPRPVERLAASQSLHSGKGKEKARMEGGARGKSAMPSAEPRNKAPSVVRKTAAQRETIGKEKSKRSKPKAASVTAKDLADADLENEQWMRSKPAPLPAASRSPPAVIVPPKKKKRQDRDPEDSRGSHPAGQQDRERSQSVAHEGKKEAKKRKIPEDEDGSAGTSAQRKRKQTPQAEPGRKRPRSATPNVKTFPESFWSAVITLAEEEPDISSVPLTPFFEAGRRRFEQLHHLARARSDRRAAEGRMQYLDGKRARIAQETRLEEDRWQSSRLRTELLRDLNVAIMEHEQSEHAGQPNPLALEIRLQKLTNM